LQPRKVDAEAEIPTRARQGEISIRGRWELFSKGAAVALSS